MTHRHVPMPLQPGAGNCRWCALPVLFAAGHKRAGEVSGRSWHPACVDIYKLCNWPAVARSCVWARDHGQCACCPAIKPETTCIGFKRYGNQISRVWETKFEYCPVEEKWRPEWDVDHIVPLWSLPAEIPMDQRERWWGLENLQTLCLVCHKAKCAAEAKERRGIVVPKRRSIGLTVTA